MSGQQGLVVVSNRVPSVLPTSGRAQGDAVGGLVSVLKRVVEAQGGLWFGWSGKSTERRPESAPRFTPLGATQLATLDLSEDEVGLYYSSFSNRTMWPLLHSFPERATIRRNAYASYRRINRRFAETLYPLLQPGDLVWVHDFHLFHVGEELRHLGWTGKIGFFLHVPFPPVDIFAILPWARQILEALTRYDLVGFQTQRDRFNATNALQTEVGGRSREGEFAHEGASVRLGVYPVGIDPAPFRPPPEERSSRSLNRPRTLSPAGQYVLLGVDRLDYTKGIPERLRAFEWLLERNPSLRGRLTFIQVSAPSRTRVLEYIREKEQVELLVGQINGRFSGANWTPIRYLYRSYKPAELAEFYRDADVFLVTPLRDGMNVVAKEFVAAQDNDPGVLVLSRFCGAAESMTEALIVNPYDIDGTALAIYRAIRMPRRERIVRWRSLMDAVSTFTAQRWCDTFLGNLSST